MKMKLFLIAVCLLSTTVYTADEEVFYDTQTALYTTDQCPICHEDDRLLDGVTNCNHAFCRPCIDEALEHRNDCPMCRTFVTTVSGEPSPAAVRQAREDARIARQVEVDAARRRAFETQQEAQRETRLVPLESTPATHQFAYNNNFIMVALPYRQDVVRMIRSLTPVEYFVIMGSPEIRWKRGALETLIGGNVAYGDPDFLPFADRQAFLLERFGLPMRPDYVRPWIPLWFRVNYLRDRERIERQQERTDENVRTLARAREAQGLR